MTTLGKIIIGIVFVGGVSLGGYVVTSFMKEDVKSVESDQKIEENTIVKNEEQTTASSSSAQETEIVTDKDMSFVDLITKGGSYKCEVTQSVSGISTKGVVYVSGVSGSLIKGEFTTQAQGMSIASYMIARDGYTYTWSSMAPTTGYKVKIPKNNQTDTTTQTSGTYSFNGSQIGSYSCSKIAVDMSLFDIPSSVVFSEIAQ